MPPIVTSATKQRLSPTTIQLQWTLPQVGQYDGLRIMYVVYFKNNIPAVVHVMEFNSNDYNIMNIIICCNNVKNYPDDIIISLSAFFKT